MQNILVAKFRFDFDLSMLSLEREEVLQSYNKHFGIQLKINVDILYSIQDFLMGKVDTEALKINVVVTPIQDKSIIFIIHCYIFICIRNITRSSLYINFLY